MNSLNCLRILAPSILMFYSLLCITSCKSDDDNKKEKTLSDCLLTKFTTVTTGSPNPETNRTYVHTFEYDGNRNLITMTDEDDFATTTFTYTNGLITKVVDDEGPYEELWTYNEDKLVSHIEGKFTDHEATYTKDFTYNVDKKLISLVRAGENAYTQTFTYEGDNVIYSSGTNSDTDAVQWSTTYANFDTKNNPFMLLANAMGKQVFFISEITIGMHISKNNSMSEVDTEEGSSTTTYEYNANGYPDKMIINHDDGSTDNVTFEYSNCQ